MATVLTREQRELRNALEDSLHESCTHTLAKAGILRDHYMRLLSHLAALSLQMCRNEKIDPVAHGALLRRAERLRNRMRREHNRLMARHDELVGQYPARK